MTSPVGAVAHRWSRFVVAVALAFAACSTNPATGRQTLTGFMTTSDEVAIGRQQNAQVLQAFGGAYNDPAIAAYVNGIGQKLARVSERQELTYTFTVLNSPIVNAFALPGGYIYITRGLLALASNEAELAGVLGHEIGHVTARHHAREQSRQVVTNIGLTVIGAVAGAPIAQGTQILAGSFLRSYSRDQEYEADLLGVRYLAAAGYDPTAMASFLAKLNAWTALEAKILGQAGADRVDYLSTHPNTLDRVRQALAAIPASAGAKPVVGTAEYLSAIDGLLFGEPVADGLIRGREFIHPLFRFRFEVPAGFQLLNSPKAVYASGPNQAEIVFDSATGRVQGSMRDYLAETLGRETKLNEIRESQVNGMDAATATTTLTTNRGRMELWATAIRFDETHVYRFRIIAPPGAGAEKIAATTVASFRKLTTAEAAKIKPLRVRVVTVAKGQTPGELASQMAFTTFQRERFDVINGLAAGAALAPGVKVKLIAPK